MSNTPHRSLNRQPTHRMLLILLYFLWDFSCYNNRLFHLVTAIKGGFMRLHHLFISGLFIIVFSILTPKSSLAEGKDHLTSEHQDTSNSKGQDRNGPEAIQTLQSSKHLPRQEKVTPHQPRVIAPRKTTQFFGTKNKDRNGPEAAQIQHNGKQPAQSGGTYGSHSAK